MYTMTNIRRKHLLISIIGIIAFEIRAILSNRIIYLFVGEDGSRSILLSSIPLQILSIAIFVIGILAFVLNVERGRSICYGIACICELIAIVMCFAFGSKLSFAIFGENRTAYIIQEISPFIGIGMLIACVIAAILGVIAKVRRNSIIIAIMICASVISAFFGFSFAVGMFGLPSAWEFEGMFFGVDQPITIILPILVWNLGNSNSEHNKSYSHLEEYKRRMRK